MGRMILRVEGEEEEEGGRGMEVAMKLHGTIHSKY